MNPYIAELKRRLTESPPSFGDGDSILTMPTQNPMSTIPKRLVTVSRNWRNICVYCPWIITTQFSICVAACAVHTNAKLSWMVCNTALS